MANVTIVIPDDVLQKARMRAVNENTSVNAVIREYLETYAGARRRQTTAIEELLDLSKRAGSRRGTAQWSRDDLHKRKP